MVDKEITIQEAMIKEIERIISNNLWLGFDDVEEFTREALRNNIIRYREVELRSRELESRRKAK